MNTTKFASKNSRSRSRKNQRDRVLSFETLQAREMLAADFMWQGDELQIKGSDANEFIAVQHDALGTRVFADDVVLAEHEGRSIDTATSISVSGGGGNDILFNYQSAIPVTLSGGAGNDFLFSENPSDELNAGDGFNWVYGQQDKGSWENAFGIEGLDLNVSTLQSTPQFDEENRIGLQVEVGGQTDIAGNAIDVTGVANVSSTGIDLTVNANLPTWTNAFGISGFDLTDTSLTLSAGTDVHDGNGYSVGLSSNMNAGGTDISIDGLVDVTENAVSAAFSGTAANWNDAFGIDGLDLKNAQLTGVGSVDADNNTELSLGISADMLLEETSIEVSGSVALTPDRIDAEFSGSVDNWDNAFGITGLTLADSEVNVTAYTNRGDDYDLHVDLVANMDVEGTEIEVSGGVDLTPDRIDAAFSGSVKNWGDAFGIGGLELTDTDLNVIASTNRSDDYDLQFGLSAKMGVKGTKVNVTGLVDVEPNRTAANLNGFVPGTWSNALGIQELTLTDTNVNVLATNDVNGSSLGIDLEADMDVTGTNVAVNGTVYISPAGISGSLSGAVGGEWSAAFGLGGLNLHDTTLTVSAANTADGSELALQLDAGMDLLGTSIGVSGTVAFTSQGVRTSLTGSVSGEWVDALGINGLQLQDTSLTIANDPATASGLNIELDTDLQLFGGYIDVIGNLGISPAGIDVSFSPPGSLDFIDLLGIPGFSLENSDLIVTAGTAGLEAAVSATMDMGSVDVGFEGVFAISKTDVSASLTGRVDAWDNAFDVPGLNLEDIVMTLGVETGVGGASMFIGLGAGTNIGTKELDVAGLVGVSVTGWDVAFRGGVNSLTSDDLVDFANTLSQAGNPNAPEIPEGALGDFELKDAYINFAPKGGNEALGIEDGFGIGGDFHEDGELLAGGEFEIDLENASFEVELDIPELDLGPVDLNDVLVDIRIAPFDSHFRVAGTASLMGSDVQLNGEMYANGTFLLTGSANVNIAGLATSAFFTVDNSGILFEATAQGAAVDAIKGTLTQDFKAVAGDAQVAIDQAQAGVDLAKTGVRRLESELADARAEAQREVDKVKSELNSAQKIVDSARASKDYWYGVRKSRYNSWRSAVNATNRTSWWNKPRYKAIEAGRYASYVAAAGTYSAKVVVHNASVVTYNGVRAAAGWALDSAGVEANPIVIGLNVQLTTAKLAVDAADAVLDGVEQVNSDALRYLDIADSLRVDRITLSGNVSNYVNAGVAAKVDFSFAGGNRSFTFAASTEDLVEQLANDLVDAIL